MFLVALQKYERPALGEKAGYQLDFLYDIHRHQGLNEEQARMTSREG